LFEERDPRIIIGGIGTLILGFYLLPKNLWIPLGEEIPLGGLVVLTGFVILLLGLNFDFRGLERRKIQKNKNKKTILSIIAIVSLLVGIEIVIFFLGV